MRVTSPNEGTFLPTQLAGEGMPPPLWMEKGVDHSLSVKSLIFTIPSMMVSLYITRQLSTMPMPVSKPFPT